MLKIEAEAHGLPAFRTMLEEAPVIIEASLPQLAMQAGQDVVDYAQYLFRKPKSGKLTVSSDGSGRTYIASAPGEAPAIDTALLDTSMTAIVRGFTVIVNRSAPTPYADYLEEGTARMAARPFMKPAHDFAADRYYASVLRLIQRAT